MNITNNANAATLRTKYYGIRAHRASAELLAARATLEQNEETLTKAKAKEAHCRAALAWVAEELQTLPTGETEKAARFQTLLGLYKEELKKARRARFEALREANNTAEKIGRARDNLTKFCALRIEWAIVKGSV